MNALAILLQSDGQFHKRAGSIDVGVAADVLCFACC